MEEAVTITSQGFISMLSFMFISMISLLIYIWSSTRKEIEKHDVMINKLTEIVIGLKSRQDLIIEGKITLPEK